MFKLYFDVTVLKIVNIFSNLFKQFYDIDISFEVNTKEFFSELCRYIYDSDIRNKKQVL